VFRRLLVLVVPVILAACGGGHKAVTLTVPSSSMEPTLHCARPAGDITGCEGEVADELVVEPTSKVQRGDIVVFTSPPAAETECGIGGRQVKRVIGLPNERLNERRGTFYVDGQELQEDYIATSRRDDRTGFWTVPKESYFVVGDNRTYSCDSRRYGSVAKEDIQGKVVAVQRPSGRVDLP
jgi:signal peptidase I